MLCIHFQQVFMKIRFTFHFNKKDPSFLEIKKIMFARQKREKSLFHTFPTLSKYLPRIILWSS